MGIPQRFHLAKLDAQGSNLSHQTLNLQLLHLENANKPNQHDKDRPDLQFWAHLSVKFLVQVGEPDFGVPLQI
jgi:hypothetical protein